MEVKPRRGGGSRAAAAAMAASQPRRSSLRAAAAGVGALVRTLAGDVDGAGGSHSPSPSFQQQGREAAPAAAGSSGKSGGKRRAGSSGRSKAADDEDDEIWDDFTDEESDGGLTAWDADADEDDEGFGRTVLGGAFAQNDYSSLALKPDHYNRPLWVCSDGRIFLETYSPIYKQARACSVLWGSCACLCCIVTIASSDHHHVAGAC